MARLRASRIPGSDSGSDARALARRERCPASSGAAGDGKPQYAAVYELSSHPDEVMAAMNAGIKDGTVHMTDAVDATSLSMTTLTPRLPARVR